MTAEPLFSLEVPHCKGVSQKCKDISRGPEHYCEDIQVAGAKLL